MIIPDHNTLYSGSSRRLGELNWFIQKSSCEMEKKSIVQHPKEEPLHVEPVQTTEFGKEVGGDEINWWVFTKETNIEDLKRKTEKTLEAAQQLKEKSDEIKKTFNPENYLELIECLKNFTKNNEKDIEVLYVYVHWLYHRDILAPSILYSYRVWGSTPLGDFEVIINSDQIGDEKELRACIESALGLRFRCEPTLYCVYNRLLRERVNSVDSEYQNSVSVPDSILIKKASQEILDGFAEYFKNIRQSLRNILVDIDKYNGQKELLYRESFWIDFIKKVINDPVERNLWDFKETFEMWHIRNHTKEIAEIKFCEEVASFANANGGVLIVGISDEIPRKVIGVSNLENKLQSVKVIISKRMNRDSDFIYLQPVQISDETGISKNCFIIAIAQTKDAVSVKDDAGRISYPKRFETGFVRVNDQSIQHSKLNILQDSHSYIHRLYRIIHETH